MSKIQLDYRGFKCPLPTLKLNQFSLSGTAGAGDLVEVVADCPTFEEDVRKWCTMSKKMLVRYYTDGDQKIAQIQF